jgi:hypothetical protein
MKALTSKEKRAIAVALRLWLAAYGARRGQYVTENVLSPLWENGANKSKVKRLLHRFSEH